jgi:hypothetical protein
MLFYIITSTVPIPLPFSGTQATTSRALSAQSSLSFRRNEMNHDDDTSPSPRCTASRQLQVSAHDIKFGTLFEDSFVCNSYEDVTENICCKAIDREASVKHPLSTPRSDVQHHSAVKVRIQSTRAIKACNKETPQSRDLTLKAS